MPQKINPNILLLLLGGSGQRFKSRIPKQFISLSDNEHPLFIRTLSSLTRFLNFHKIILVVNSEFLNKQEFLEPLSKYIALNPNPYIDIIAGAQTRHESFLNGARYILSQFEYGTLLVHDANRPFISQAFAIQIQDKLQQLNTQNPCFIPVLSLTDSICRIENEQVSAYVPRDQIMAIQTPQLLYIPSMRKAIQIKEAQSLQKDFTDEGSFMLSMGFPVYTYQGDLSNKKITFSEDLK